MNKALKVRFVAAGIFAGTQSGVFHSANNGTGWKAVNTGLLYGCVNALVVSGGNLFAGTEMGGVWRRPLAEMAETTEVINYTQQQVLGARDGFKILSSGHCSRNKTLEFFLPHSDQVTVTVYDMRGSAVSSLVNSVSGAGVHRISWNSRNLADGIYTVKLVAGINRYTKRVSIFR